MAYIKRKFFQCMCSECLYLIDEPPPLPDVCPNCGRVFNEGDDEDDEE